MTSPETPAPNQPKFHILDLFAGPGGLDVAAHFLDIPSLGVEWDGNACETRYWAGLPTVHADVRQFRKERFHELPSTINVLAGGPPCQTYSVAGSGRGRSALTRVEKVIDLIVAGTPDEEIDAKLDEWSPGDPRTGLVLEPLRWLIKSINDRGPESIEAIVLEQVPAVEAVWIDYANVLRSGLPKGVEYDVQVDTFRTEEFGVPQTRKRAVLVARLKGRGTIAWPPETTHLPFTRRISPVDAPIPASEEALFRVEPEHASVSRKQQKKEKPVTMGAVLKKTRTREFVVVSNYGQGGDPKKRGRRTSSEPAFTVTGKVSRNVVLDGGDENLRSKFSIHEAGVLQTFPADYPWSGGDQSQQVGNAVPPLFGMHIIKLALGLDKKIPESLGSWPEVSPEERDAVRANGCGDRSRCPQDSRHPATTPAASAL